jgi:hypothetical protein
LSDEDFIDADKRAKEVIDKKCGAPPEAMKELPVQIPESMTRAS